MTIIDRLEADHRKELDRAASLRAHIATVGRWLEKHASTLTGTALADALVDLAQTRDALEEAEQLAIQYKQLLALAAEALPGPSRTHSDALGQPIEAAARAAVPSRDGNGRILLPGDPIDPGNTPVDGPGDE